MKSGAKSDAKLLRKDDGTPVALPNPLDTNPLDTFTPKAVETANLSLDPTLGELGADLSLSSISPTEPSTMESDGFASGLQINQITGPASLETVQ
ncbi:MAG TPA: hypothetical protein VNY05_12650, partial [Candidatus Acidoferrales bacterium]|nr:hypothetical protein [Candidatus Acidoferrales bacterium]